MLTHQEIVIKLRDSITNNRDIECFQDFTVDFYTLFGLARHSFNEIEFNIAFKMLALLTHPDKGDYPNRNALMQYINNARDTLRDPSKRSAYDKTLPSLSRERPGAPDQEEENSREYRSESPLNDGCTGPMGLCSPMAIPHFRSSEESHQRGNFRGGEHPLFKPRQPSFTSSLNPPAPPRGSDAQNCYLMFFCITNGSHKGRHAKANELINKYVEEKKRGTGHLFQNNQLSNKTETVTFSFSRITEYQFDDAEENFLVITLSTKEITLGDAFIKRASRLYTIDHPECKTSVAQESFFSCCLP